MVAGPSGAHPRQMGNSATTGDVRADCIRARIGEKAMSDTTRKDDAVAEEAKLLREHQDCHEHEDEEKILAGRHDVNYPALLTKDVPGG